MLQVTYLQRNTKALKTIRVTDWGKNIGFIKQIPNLFNHNSKRICHYTFLAQVQKSTDTPFVPFSMCLGNSIILRTLLSTEDEF